ncbi:MAG: hypothetical protein ACXVHV_06775, partial [Methanobacterium sp.]
ATKMIIRHAVSIAIDFLSIYLPQTYENFIFVVRKIFDFPQHVETVKIYDFDVYETCFVTTKM